MENTNQNVEQPEVVPVVITSSMIYNMLKSGKDRATITKELKLSVADAKVIFSAPSLRGVKVAKPSNIQFIDDLSAQPTENNEEEEVVEENDVTEEIVEENTTVEYNNTESNTEPGTQNNPWGQSAE